MTTEQPTVVTSSREIAADAARIFELIADPARQPSWDGNDNLVETAGDQRVHAIGDIFATTLTNGGVRENRVVEFEEGRRIAWKPSDVGAEPAGHLWRWELEPLDDGCTLVTHTYDWSGLTDEKRFPRACSTSPEMLAASLERLATAAETS
ncbi:SRPBCC family protein [Pseudonocardia phyllosphaerae]|uniref:SRPBCC family protein n=1 Tax=Pseudonocardia phyllosphaerae TaxID=3390502 RepID=UPI003978EB6C